MNQGGFVLIPRRGWRVGAVAQDEPGPRGDFLLPQFGQPRVLTLQALEEKQERLVPARLQPVADFPDWLDVFVRVGEGKFGVPPSGGWARAEENFILSSLDGPSRVNAELQTWPFVAARANELGRNLFPPGPSTFRALVWNGILFVKQAHAFLKAT